MRISLGKILERKVYIHLDQHGFKKVRRKSHSWYQRIMKKEFILNSQFKTFIEPREI